MNPTYDFTGQVALVTGASSGMGLATAQAFAEAGAAVVLADINDQTLGAATDELTASGHQALGVTCDVANEDQAAAMVEDAVASFGRLDMAFNNAGIQVPPTDAADEPAENFDRVNACSRSRSLGQVAGARPWARWPPPSGIRPSFLTSMWTSSPGRSRW